MHRQFMQIARVDYVEKLFGPFLSGLNELRLRALGLPLSLILHLHSLL